MSNVELVLWSALCIGVVFGVAGQLSGFCLHRGLAQHFQGLQRLRSGASQHVAAHAHSATVANPGRSTVSVATPETVPAVKLQSFALALFVAIVGTQWVAYAGWVDLTQSIYLAGTFSWLLVPLGGVLFGYGMTLSNGCGARALVLLGQGNLRSAVVLLCLGVSAYATLTGVLAPLRVGLVELTSWSPGSFGGPYTPYYVAAALLFLAGLLGFSLRKATLLRHKADFFGALVIGLLVVAGWLVTGVLGADDFDPVPLESMTFVAPVGATLQYLMIATGVDAGFGVLVVAGVVAGSLVSALVGKRFKWQGFESPLQMRRYMAGGILMGVGGALAMGCSIGQGLTGLSTLALGSVMALLGILAGSRLALNLHQTSL